MHADTKGFTPASIHALLTDLEDHPESIAEVAHQHRADPAALNRYLITSPEVAEAYTAAIVRARILAASQLPDAIGALQTILRVYQSQVARTPYDPTARANLAAHADLARRAAHLLLRIANLTPRALTSGGPTPHDLTPSPRATTPEQPASRPPETSHGNSPAGPSRTRTDHPPSNPPLESCTVSLVAPLPTGADSSHAPQSPDAGHPAIVPSSALPASRPVQPAPSG